MAKGLLLLAGPELHTSFRVMSRSPLERSTSHTEFVIHRVFSKNWQWLSVALSIRNMCLKEEVVWLSRAHELEKVLISVFFFYSHTFTL